MQERREGRGRPGASPAFRVVALSAAMALLAGAGCLALAGADHPLLDTPWAPWWAVAGLTAVGELMAVHLEGARSTYTFTVKELPMVVGLAVLDPVTYVATQVLGSAVALALDRRQDAVKLAFNVSRVALEGVVAAAAFTAVLAAAGSGTPGGADPAGPAAWLAAGVALVAVDLVAAAAISAVIRLHTGGRDTSGLRSAVGTGLLVTLANTAIGVVGLVLLAAQPAALPLLAVFYAVLFASYRDRARLQQEQARMEQLSAFTRRIAEPAEPAEVLAAVLRETRAVLGAGAALAVVTGPDGRTALSLRLDGAGLRSPAPDAPVGAAPGAPGAGRRPWWAPAAAGAPVLRPRGGRRTGDARAHGDPADGVAVPLTDADRVIGLLAVSGRTSAVSTFTAADLDLLQTLGAQAALSAQRAWLVRQLREQLAAREHAARHDALTGLPNRAGLVESLDASLSAARGGGVLTVDLDRFRDVNDALGHPTGDAVLRVLAERLHRFDPGTARVGSDTFCLPLPAGAGAEAARARAVQVQALLAEPVVAADVAVDVRATIGLAWAPDHGQRAHELLQHADTALHRAKGAGEPVATYSVDDGVRSRRQLVLAADLGRALGAAHPDGVEVWYQPQSATDGTILGVEALVRWTHPRLGPVSPMEVVATAGRTGQLLRLTDTVLGLACAQAARWRAEGMPLRVSVNLTTADVLDPGLPGRVAHHLRASGLPARALTLEITEDSSVLESGRRLDSLDRLAEAGVGLSVDDFGTGYSSLTYLTRLPVHELKIDKSFVLGEHDDRDDAVVAATVELAHRLGLRVVAEGVEDAAAWTRVAALGCDVLQGYVLSRPLPTDDLTAVLRLPPGRLHLPR